jgi:hypothetical protein
MMYGDDVRKMLAHTNRRHDLISIALDDPREQMLPVSGLYSLRDAETGEMFVLDASDRDARRRFKEWNRQRIDARRQLFRANGIDHLAIQTHQSYSDALVRFFKERHRRGRFG